MHFHRTGALGAMAVIVTLCYCGGLPMATHDGHEEILKGLDDRKVATNQTTHAFFLLDRTGSMNGNEGAVKGGFNNFVETQKGVRAGGMFIDVAQFDSDNPFEMLMEKKPIAEVGPLERFEPRAMTPLYDAISSMIDHAERVADTPDVIIVVFTDGQENASKRASQKAVLQRVEEKKRLGWTFVFLGSNIDAYATGGGLGYSRGSTKTFGSRPDDHLAAWAEVSASMTKARHVRAAPSYTASMRAHDSANYFG